ncbi:MAG TPA: hypothetical protein VLH08_07970 [Acidobacteriota bacterium]|nr:hypothetical protein [Acidobacteriota bacterium]
MNTKAQRAIFVGGSLAGIMDFTAATIFYGFWRNISPIQVWQSVASGFLGMSAYDGGVPTAILGVFCHFVIAFTAAATFYTASRRISLLVQHPIISGILYGIAVFWFMQLIVLPLSAFPHKLAFPLIGVIRGSIIHIVCVGLPISLSTYKFSSQHAMPSPRHGIVL